MVGRCEFGSAWADLARPAAFQTDVVRPFEQIDMVVVGGGILGLTAAVRAARAGASVRLIEAREIGEGASGLNGGQVIPGFKHDADWLIRAFGAARGKALIAFGAGMADAVFSLIAKEQLDVPCQRAGWIQAAHTPGALLKAERNAREWIAEGVPAKILSASEIAEVTGARGYVGGWLDPRAGVIEPLAFTRELARLASGAGVKIAPRTRAIKLRREAEAWTVDLAEGQRLNAKCVIVATNAYTDGLVPGLARTLLPLHSFQIATPPLSPSQGYSILPGGQAVSDSRRIVVYYRKSPDGRLLFGGRGKMAEPTSPQAWAHLEHALGRLFPALRGVAIERRWFGRVAMTLDYMPHVHEPEPGLITAVGCQGRGVGLMTALGPLLADYALNRDRDVLPFPVTPIRPIPLHRFRHVGIGAAISGSRFNDALGF